MLRALEVGTNPNSSHRSSQGTLRDNSNSPMCLLLENPRRPRNRSHKKTWAKTIRVEPSKLRTPVYQRPFSSISTVYFSSAGIYVVCKCQGPLQSEELLWFSLTFVYFLSKAHDKLDWRLVVQHRPMSKKGIKTAWNLLFDSWALRSSVMRMSIITGHKWPLVLLF